MVLLQDKGKENLAHLLHNMQQGLEPREISSAAQGCVWPVLAQRPLERAHVDSRSADDEPDGDHGGEVRSVPLA